MGRDKKKRKEGGSGGGGEGERDSNFVYIHFYTNPYSPGILSPKDGQPNTNCKRRFFNGFWSRNMSSITYQDMLCYKGYFHTGSKSNFMF